MSSELLWGRSSELLSHQEPTGLQCRALECRAQMSGTAMDCASHRKGPSSARRSGFPTAALWGARSARPSVPVMAQATSARNWAATLAVGSVASVPVLSERPRAGGWMVQRTAEVWWASASLGCSWAEGWWVQAMARWMELSMER